MTDQTKPLFKGEYFLIDIHRPSYRMGKGGTVPGDYEAFRTQRKLETKQSNDAYLWRKTLGSPAMTKNEFTTLESAQASLELHKEQFPGVDFYITRGFNL